MNWETDPIEVPRERTCVTLGDMRFSLLQSGDGVTWQHFSLTFGHHTADTDEQCKSTWPREAIAEARKRIDAAERSLDE